MFNRLILPFALPAVIILIAAGCATTTQGNTTVREARPQEISVRVRATGWAEKEVRRASELYALKCGRCHKFYDPAAYPAEDWNVWMRKMCLKAKLEPVQQETLTHYLEAAQRTTPPR